MALHKLNRERLCTQLKQSSDVVPGSVIVLQGGDSHGRYCSDVDVTTFRQASQIEMLDPITEHLLYVYRL